MKNVIQKATIVLGVALIAFTACKKEDMKKVVAATNTEETEMVALVDQAGNDMLYVEATDENPEMGVSMLNEGISADFLVEEADLDEAEGPAGSTDNLRRHVRSHSFIACLRKLDLNEKQTIAIRKSLREYRECKESAVKRARAIYQKLVSMYQDKLERLHKAYKNGDISKEKYMAAIKELRQAFHKELRSLQLQEKLDEAFKKCYRILLGNLNQILSDKQWKVFVNCHKR